MNILCDINWNLNGFNSLWILTFLLWILETNKNFELDALFELDNAHLLHVTLSHALSAYMRFLQISINLILYIYIRDVYINPV